MDGNKLLAMSTARMSVPGINLNDLSTVPETRETMKWLLQDTGSHKPCTNA